MDNTPSGCCDNLGKIRQGCRRSLRLARKRPMSSVLLSKGHRCAFGCGRACSPVAKRAALRIPSPEPHLPNADEGERARSVSPPRSPTMARESMDSRDYPTTLGETMAASPTQGSPSPSERADIPPPPRQTGPLGLARERFNLNAVGLPDNVIATIQSAQAPSTRSLYDNKLRVFEKWCDENQTRTFQCSVSEVLCVLQSLLDKGKAFSTIKVYLAAISACHVGFDGASVGKHPLVSRFMKGVRRLRPPTKQTFPSWDLSVVLDELSEPPFEPMENIAFKQLSLKTVLLLALVSAKRVGELRALSVHPSCLQVSEEGKRALLSPNPSFVPKVIEASYRCSSLDLNAFHPPPFSSREEERWHRLCPVHALRIYVDRTKAFRKTDQLFVSWSAARRGLPISSQRLSHWMVEAIGSAYEARGMQPPARLKAHSTRGMATSWALFRGISVSDICSSASWESAHTFTRFYSLDVTKPSLAHAVLGVGIQ
ncbi:uncharacterized protein LOC134469834 [Engraulis encrasicolus]|uniref:uncharacterized protein LOC134469834 n=1 Tax=Engraulis encrasicolus TaxID=184585 RepID=UPI002FCFC305